MTYYVHMHLGRQHILHSGQAKDRGQLCGVDSVPPFCECCVSDSDCQLSETSILPAKLSCLFNVIIFERWVKNIGPWVDVGMLCRQGKSCMLDTCLCLGGGCKTPSSSV